MRWYDDGATQANYEGNQPDQPENPTVCHPLDKHRTKDEAKDFNASNINIVDAKRGSAVPSATAPQPPKIPMARACWAGSGKTLTIKVSADGTDIAHAERILAYFTCHTVVLTDTTQSSQNDQGDLIVHKTSTQRE